jgi:S-adenosylmethionine:tRNA ribosyltransferase-isomerase
VCSSDLPNDVLVFNDSKVFPARILGKKETGGKAELLLLKELTDGWEVLVGTKNPQAGTRLIFASKLEATLVEKLPEKSWKARFNVSNEKLQEILLKIGKMPLPPYIHSEDSEKSLQKKYQTIYAERLGSAAAPTAGLHFTRRLLNKIKRLGVQLEFVTLHVGLGTFNPVNTENIEDYKIHHEWVHVPKTTIDRLKAAKAARKRIIAVGTTSVRTLEAIFSQKSLPNTEINQEVDIFIFPGYSFKFVDAMITNFHLPKSSLIMLVSALIGRGQTLKLYKLAIKLKYRFFSFGDAMFLK